jgi:NADPH:quinone reductase-like Zn-dependent oxidoreductase
MASTRKSSTHKAVQLLHGFNDDPLKACSLVEKVTPVPGKDGVLIHMLCRPVHPADVLSVQGHFPRFKPKKFPITIGSEGVGEISEARIMYTDPDSCM